MSKTLLEVAKSRKRKKKAFFDKELLKHQHATADQMEVRRLTIGKNEAIDLSKECFDAIGMLTTNV